MGTAGSEFWANSGIEKWPRDRPGYVFLARAVDRIGRALCGTEWLPFDMAPTPRPPTILQAVGNPALSIGPESVRLASEADKLLRAHRMDISRPPRPNVSPLPHLIFEERPEWLKLTEDEWNAALETGRALEQQARDAMVRARQVRETIADLAFTGRLKVYLRSNGHMVPTAKEAWNSDNLAPRFTMCRMDPHNPLGAGFDGPKFCDLFVSEDELAALIRTMPHSSLVVTSADLSALSPYLRFAVGFALNHEITHGDNQAGKEWLKAQITADWNASNDTPLTGKTLDALYQVIRFENAEAVQHGLRGADAKKKG